MIKQIIITQCKEYSMQPQNRVPGFVAERCRWQMQRGEDGAAVKIWRNTAIFWAPQEGLRSNFKSFCPCQKKAPNFRCFFPLFTLLYGDFTCFSHIDKTSAHGFFPYAVFSFSHRFMFTLCHTIRPIRLVHHQKSINHNSNPLVITFSFLYNFLFFVRIHICRFNTVW